MNSIPIPGADESAVADESDVTITVCPDGPLLVRGAARILDTDGNPLGDGRATVALCRCGRTSIAPFCDSSHKKRRRP
ncbi:CDGSH iron-sulfur domain-containing protein [Rhodococcus sp. IEGM 1351]|uniref:CDGSH iron-sulfur domain-containing protein n=1 Tax=Rhodococcus sp. IEGM 1351 TaxID=3047089 RepID=UPI0024B837B0|nr:CDGSH iron-sulfur domain-containing protein [Rhodococcus sp. IEGM 1351]MDI9938229.1 CDGSH iron-sulfur domain-containing protein [Rhodococcus sp. IEGM 1351]